MNRLATEVQILNIRTILVASSLSILLTAGTAYPQKKEILQLQADMIRLSQQVNQLQMSMDRNHSALKGLVEQMADQVNRIGTGMQTVNQIVDGLKTQDDQTSNELRVSLTNLNNKVNELEQGLASLRTQITSLSQQITSMKTTVEPLGGPDDLMRTAMVDYLAGNYDLALSGFQEFLSKYPDDPRAGEAQLSRAEAYFNQKQYDRAVVEYDLFLQKYPGHDKTKTALYKKGLALAEQDQPQQALTTLNQVVKEFPNTSEATNAQAKIRELRAASRRSR